MNNRACVHYKDVRPTCVNRVGENFGACTSIVGCYAVPEDCYTANTELKKVGDTEIAEAIPCRKIQPRAEEEELMHRVIEDKKTGKRHIEKKSKAEVIDPTKPHVCEVFSCPQYKWGDKKRCPFSQIYVVDSKGKMLNPIKASKRGGK